MKYSKLALALAFSTTTLFLTACGSDNDNNSSSSTPAPQTYIAGSEVIYTANDEDAVALAGVAKSITVIDYKMPSVDGKTVTTSAIVLFPDTPQPRDGYRMVVWAHGTLGVADVCAPSVTQLGGNFRDYTAKNLLAAGYVIVAPDYEGLGGEGIHPYLNIESEANSAIYAVKAAKEHYGKQLNGAWMSVGQSQGGQASLGIAQYANADATYKGAVAGAPASSLDHIILNVAPAALKDMESQENAVGLPIAGRTSISTYATLLSYAALAGAGITAYTPTFDYREMFKGANEDFEGANNAQALAELAEERCLGTVNDKPGLVEEYAKDITEFLAQNPEAELMDYPGMNEEAFTTNDVVKDFLANRSQPTTEKLSKPILVIQGTHDTNVPYVVTKGLVDQMQASGTNVSLLPVVQAGHTGAIISPSGQAAMAQFIQQHMPSQ